MGARAVIRKRLQRRIDDATGGYQPRLVITVEGLDDVYRLARHLETGQVEFGRLGRRILRSMDDQAPGVVRHMTERMGPSNLLGGARGGRRPRPKRVQLELGMAPEALATLEEAIR
jgi:hypothetical protein